MQVVAARMGTRVPPLSSYWLKGALLAVMYAGPLLMPFDLECLIAYHFNKVKAQTKMNMKDAVEFGRAHGVRVDNIEKLLAIVDARAG